MNGAKPVFFAKRIPASVFSDITKADDVVGAAHETAQSLISQAKADAETTAHAILKKAREESRAVVENVKNTATQKAKAHAAQSQNKIFSDLSKLSQAIQDDFDALEPWLVQLVSTAVWRIVGAI